MKPSLVPLYYSSQNPHAKPTFSSTAGAAPPCWTTTVLFAAVQCAIVKPLGNGVLRNNPIKFLISLLPLVLKNLTESWTFNLNTLIKNRTMVLDMLI
ncbi:hypothetical protein P8452_37247 [Trifolium repens]|nr:hypothetical protein P8452_37247 [Trifolium repens]